MLAQIKQHHADLVQSFRRLNESDRTIPSSYLSEYLEKLEAFIALSASAQVFCAMSVEALLNLYGVVRLGEEFYKRNLERSGVVPKLEILLATCDGILLPKDAELSALLRKISQKRNELVHPKSREFRVDRMDSANWPDELPKTVESAVTDMERFFELFAGLNEHTKATSQFFDL
jgi:hypothetical protein